MAALRLYWHFADAAVDTSALLQLEAEVEHSPAVVHRTAGSAAAAAEHLHPAVRNLHNSRPVLLRAVQHDRTANSSLQHLEQQHRTARIGPADHRTAGRSSLHPAAGSLDLVLAAGHRDLVLRQAKSSERLG